ncbi:uncharacterized protein LOC131248608 isoform X2 [Magnolia sinica]|uniref:uncharacterized protein LOC131248608 isoform X2 n=1 Tax=Magnolia sinica TaxID=86752 RepID=UPI00265A5064|nr:uncharacterized protein LOC131248608 isoform X2 [Magnolia sinica]
MEAAAGGAAAGRGGPLPIPSSQPSRKEWRAVSEHSVRNAGNEEMDRMKLGQSEERTIYEVQHGTGPVDVDFCSVTIDSSLNSDVLQQRLHGVSRQREELQQMEIELRAQVIARSEILEMQKGFDAQIKEHANTAAKLKEQLQEREQCIHELEIKMEEKDRELRAIKIDNEAAWAKEDLLREQNQELATYRREHDNFEAERSQHLKQIHDLKEHIQEKESQILELEEQHRVAQESILYKDEQLREAQAWVARVQEMDAIQSTTNHSLQAELRERTEQFNQFWIGCQRQFAEMERHHMQTIQQLQMELAEARDRNGIYTDDSRTAHANSHANSKESSPYVQNKGNQFSVNEGGPLSGNSGILPNGNIDRAVPFVSADNASTKTDHVPGVPIVPPSILGMGPFLPPAQVPALHPFVMHQQSVPPPQVNPHIAQSHMTQFQTIPAISSQQHWQSQQAVSESSQIPNQTPYHPSEDEQSLLRPDAHYDYELSAEGQVVHSDYLEAHISPQQRPGPAVPPSSEEPQVLESNDKRYLVSQEPQQNLGESSPQFHDSLRLDPPEQKSEPKVNLEIPVDKPAGNDSANLSFQQRDDESTMGMVNQLQDQGLTMEQPWSAAGMPLSAPPPTQQVSSSDATDRIASGAVVPEVPPSSGRTSSSLTPGKIPQPTLLDERSLLACIVRAIPAGSSGGIRITTTLPNRLGKMLAPLHWHDYKKQYGKLDDFVARHPELFVIEGDFIHLREGAQKRISATTAVAKVAAAAAVSAPYSSLLPTVAVTPVAQNHRLKKVPSIDPKSEKTILCAETATSGNPSDARDKALQLSAMQGPHSNGVCYDIVHGLSHVKLLRKSKDTRELNGFSSETRPGHTSVHMMVGNGGNLDRAGSASFQNDGSSNGRTGANFVGKQQGRNCIGDEACF